MEKIPSLAGQPAFFIFNQLFLMREGVRKVEAMAPIVKDLKDDDLTRCRSTIRKLPAQAERRAARPGAGQARRRRFRISAAAAPAICRTLPGQDQMPRIAKQRIDYLIESLKEFRDNTRPGGDTAMSANLARATDADIAALAHYAASL